jgi:hypothetical protein
LFIFNLNMNIFKYLIGLFLVLNCNKIISQRIEYTGGINRNRFYDFKNDDNYHYYRSDYEVGKGFSFGFSVEDIRTDSIPMRLTLNVSNYKGTVNVADGYLNGGSRSEFTANKYVISAGIYPLNFKYKKNIHFNLGLQIDYLIAQSIIGNHYYYHGLEAEEKVSLTNTNLYYYIDVQRNIYFGVALRISYDIPLPNDWFIVPQYSFYFGLTKEFKNIESNTNSLRHLFSLGFSKLL